MVSTVKRGLKYALSFRRQEWTALDYPLSVEQDPKSKRWSALILGWTMAGFGATKEEAIADLDERLRAYRKTWGLLPRPGTSVGIVFASRAVVSAHEDLAREFFPPILHLDYDDCVVTDESSLSDFDLGESPEEIARKVLLVFKTDVSDLVATGNIAAILERIAATRRGSA